MEHHSVWPEDACIYHCLYDLFSSSCNIYLLTTMLIRYATLPTFIDKDPYVCIVRKKKIKIMFRVKK